MSSGLSLACWTSLSGRTFKIIPEVCLERSAGQGVRVKPLAAEGRASTAEIAKNLEFLHLDHADPRRGSRGNFRNRKNHGLFHLDHADPRRGPREHRRNRKKPWVFAPRLPAKGRAGTLKIAKNPWVFAPRPHRSPQRVDFRVVSSALPRRPKKRF